MTYLNSDHFILIFAFLLIVLVTLCVNRVYSYDDPFISKLREDLINIDPRSKELVFNASNESFTEDKKMVYLCIKDKDGKYYDYNMLMYVALHELAHAFSESVDMEHKGDEFKTNFKQLLDKAERMGYFDSKKPLDYNYCPKI
jgi:hypothetical protein